MNTKASTCGTCKFKGASVTRTNNESFDQEDTGYFECDLIKHDEHYVYMRGQSAVVIDGSGYMAALCVEDDFGCIKWERS